MLPALLLLGCIAAEPVPAVNAAALKKEQEQCWADLDRNDFPLVLKATLKLSVHPKETVQFLKAKMMPLKIEKEEAKKRLKDLDSEDEKVWKQAFETLVFYDPRLAMSVKDAYETVSTGPGQTRLMAILAGQPADYYEGQSIQWKSEDEQVARFQSGRHGWGVFQKVDMLMMRWIRLNRSITLLEHLGTTEAIEILKSMSKGHPDADPTKAAKAALNRVFAMSEPIPVGNEATKRKELDQCWAKILGGEEDEIMKSVFRLSALPKETVQYFSQRIKPVKIEKAEVVKLLKKLDSEDDKVWKPAGETLRYYDPRLVMKVKEAYETIPAGPHRMRIVAIFTNQTVESFDGKEFVLTTENEEFVDFKCENHTWVVGQTVTGFSNRQWLRLEYGTVLLEHFGTLEAIEVLETIAKSHPDIGPTKAAKAALKRLNAE